MLNWLRVVSGGGFGFCSVPLPEIQLNVMYFSSGSINEQLLFLLLLHVLLTEVFGKYVLFSLYTEF